MRPSYPCNVRFLVVLLLFCFQFTAANSQDERTPNLLYTHQLTNIISMQPAAIDAATLARLGYRKASVSDSLPNDGADDFHRPWIVRKKQLSFDARGRETKRTYLLDSEGNYYYQFHYGPNGRLDSIQHYDGKQWWSVEQLKYDANGQLTRREHYQIWNKRRPKPGRYSTIKTLANGQIQHKKFYLEFPEYAPEFQWTKREDEKGRLTYVHYAYWPQFKPRADLISTRFQYQKASAPSGNIWIRSWCIDHPQAKKQGDGLCNCYEFENAPADRTEAQVFVNQFQTNVQLTTFKQGLPVSISLYESETWKPDRNADVSKPEGKRIFKRVVEYSK